MHSAYGVRLKESKRPEGRSFFALLLSYRNPYQLCCKGYNRLGFKLGRRRVLDRP